VQKYLLEKLYRRLKYLFQTQSVTLDRLCERDQHFRLSLPGAMAGDEGQELLIPRKGRFGTRDLGRAKVLDDEAEAEASFLQVPNSVGLWVLSKDVAAAVAAAAVPRAPTVPCKSEERFLRRRSPRPAKRAQRTEKTTMII